MEYGIIFPWRVWHGKRVLDADELFVPYSAEYLQELVDEKSEMMYELYESQRNGYTFAEFVEEGRRYRETNEGYFKHVHRIEGDLERAWFIQKGLGELSLWDYLADFRTVYAMYRYRENLEYRDRVSMLADLDMLSRMHLNMTKVHLSLLVNCRFENTMIDEEPIVEYTDWVIDVISRPEYHRQRNLDGIAEERLRRFEVMLNDSAVRGLVENINVWIRTLLGPESLSFAAQKDVISMIRKKIFQFPRAMDPVCYEKSKFVKALNVAHKLRYTPEQILKCAISTEEYHQRKYEMFNAIVANTISQRAEILDVEQQNFEATFKELKNAFNDENLAPGVSKKKYKVYGDKKDSCFAIMQETNGKRYFALSGVREYPLHKETNKYDMLAKIIMEKVLCPTETIDITTVRNHNYTFNWAYLTEDALRYLEFGTRDESDEYIDIPVSLKEDLKVHYFDKETGAIGTSYGCCERKIATFADENKDKLYMIRWAPCVGCRPVMVSDKCNIKIYALAQNFKDWKKNGCGSELKEYKIVKRYKAVEES